MVIFGNERGLAMLIVGGYPKGFEEPFHPETKSGKILRGLLSKHHINAKIIDLWKTREEEQAGKISNAVWHEIACPLDVGFPVVALGRHVYASILKCTDWKKFYTEDEIEKKIGVYYLPHPASRRPQDLARLEQGLVALTGRNFL